MNTIWLIKWNGKDWRWEVGYYKPDMEWEAIQNFKERADAYQTCHYLNGGK
ncbi:MAG: hypothetical protein PHQ33_07320 [Bacteroidales bacterium]|nr:hypothetical protein [Bacteroidales bacterium]